MVITPEDAEKLILHRDGMMLVLNKPAGIPVHKGFGGGETLDEAFPHLQFGLPMVPQLAHRLDKATSGCLVLGRHKQALKQLGEMFAQGHIEKTYWALVHGVPAEAQGVINKPLAKQIEQKHLWWMKVDEEKGQSAVTEYRVVAIWEGIAWLELKPKTGRTHQLRVHCASLGCPIVGDGIYGDRHAPREPMCLHARSVLVPIRKYKEPVLVEAPPPEHMARCVVA